MNETDFSDFESPSKEWGMSVTIDERTDTMMVIAKPTYIYDVLIMLFGMAFGLVAIAITSSNFTNVFVLFLAISVGIPLYQIYKKRVISCIIRKTEGTVQYFRGGILGTHINEQNLNFLVLDVVGFETRLFAGGVKDAFHILMVLRNKKKLPLSAEFLYLSNCQTKLEMIQKFVNLDLPVRALG